MKKAFAEMQICDKSHRPEVEVYCTQCQSWVCSRCKPFHLDHEGLLKDFEELTNQHIQIYADHLRQLKAFFKKLEQTPNEVDYDEIKSEIAVKISSAYNQLAAQLAKHKEMQIKRILDYVELAKKKRQKMEAEARMFQDCVETLHKTLFKIKKCNVNKIPKDHLIKYNNFSRVKYHEESIENVKKAIERCSRIREKFMRLKMLEVKVQLKDTYISKLIQIPNNFKEEPRLLLIQPKSRNIIVANLETMKKRLITLNDKEFKFPQYFEFIEVKHKVILCGGDNGTKRYLPNTYEISVDSGDLKELASMEVPKKFHSLCALTNTEVYSIGGLGTSGPLKTCEMLDLVTNQWVVQCPLNERREGPSSCALGGKYLYCIGGRAGESEIFTTIELLDTSFPKLGWALIQLQADVWKPMYFGLCCPLDQKHILIAGGMTAGQIPLATSYILDAEDCELTEIKSMQMPDCFFERDKKVFKGKLYAIAYSSYAIHIFDTYKSEWGIIKSTSIGQSEERKSFA